MENYVKFAREGNYAKFNDSVRTRLTEKLCSNERVQDYMDKKEMYREIQERAQEARKIIKGE